MLENVGVRVSPLASSSSSSSFFHYVRQRAKKATVNTIYTRKRDPSSSSMAFSTNQTRKENIRRILFGSSLLFRSFPLPSGVAVTHGSHCDSSFRKLFFWLFGKLGCVRTRIQPRSVSTCVCYRARSVVVPDSEFLLAPLWPFFPREAKRGC